MACSVEQPLPRLRRVEVLERLPRAWYIHVGTMDVTTAEVVSV